MLAKKEEELRRLNEEIEEKNKVMFAEERASIPEPNLPEPDFRDQEEEEAAEQEEEKDEEFESALSEVERYREVKDRNEGLERKSMFQTAKIEALESELENAMRALGEKEAKLSEFQREGRA